MTTSRLDRDQTGLVGKIAVVWILIGVLVLVAGFDGIAIAFTKYRVEDLAGNAASAAAIQFKQSGKSVEACQAAVDYVAEHDTEAKIPTAGCAIDPKTGVASITVRKEASTLVAQRLGFTREYTHLESTESVSPPI
jgi:hypothetical protein